MAKIFNRALQIAGEKRTISSVTQTVVSYDSAGNITECYGATIPTDASAGFAVGCVWKDSDSGAGATFYINEGSTTSCDFNVAGTGERGATGPTGSQGTAGAAGATGAQGTQGTAGTAAQQTGPTGPTGPTGASSFEYVTIGLTGSSLTGRSGVYTTGSTIHGYYISSVTGSPNPTIVSLAKNTLGIDATLSTAPGGTDAFTITVSMLLA